MKPWRARFSRFTPLAALLFAWGGALPRPGLIFHEHAGGDHVHVHGDELAGEESESEDQRDHDYHHDHHQDHGATADRPDAAFFEAPDGVHLGHWHSQHPFHRVVAPALSTLANVFNLVGAAPEVQVEVLTASLLAHRARAPPAATLV